MARSPTLVKRSYHRWVFLLGCISLGVPFGFIIILAVLTQVYVGNSCDEACNDFEPALIMCASAVGFALFICLVSWIGKARYDEKRQLAAQTKALDKHLAARQPEPDISALPLPLTVRVNTRWRPFLLLFGIVFGFLSVLLSGAIIATHFTAPQESTLKDLAPVGFSGLITMGIFFLIAILLWWQLDITQNGITIHQGGRTRTIRWDEARLFSLPKENTGTAKGPWYFELASQSSIIGWSYVVNSKDNPVAPQSNIAPDEHNRTIDALNAYVVARTGLKLHDFRET